MSRSRSHGTGRGWAIGILVAAGRREAQPLGEEARDEEGDGGARSEEDAEIRVTAGRPRPGYELYEEPDTRPGEERPGENLVVRLNDDMRTGRNRIARGHVAVVAHNE